jgi:periplasmic nitrate reductase NapE
MSEPEYQAPSSPDDTRRQETKVFAFLTVFLAPMLAVALVGSYGLVIWLYQMFAGPPKG